MHIISLLIIALSLSIDAFSLSLAYSLLKIKKSKILFISLLTGLFHFILSLTGSMLGNKLSILLKINSKIVLMLVLLYILIEVIKNSEESKKINPSLKQMLLFSFLVSIDSFSIGFGINYVTSHIVYASFVFLLFSASFTYIGFILGNYLTTVKKKKVKPILIILLFTAIAYFLCKA